MDFPSLCIPLRPLRLSDRLERLGHHQGEDRLRVEHHSAAGGEKIDTDDQGAAAAKKTTSSVQVTAGLDFIFYLRGERGIDARVGAGVA